MKKIPWSQNNTKNKLKVSHLDHDAIGDMVDVWIEGHFMLSWVYESYNSWQTKAMIVVSQSNHDSLHTSTKSSIHKPTKIHLI